MVISGTLAFAYAGLATHVDICFAWHFFPAASASAAQLGDSASVNSCCGLSLQYARIIDENFNHLYSSGCMA